MSKIVFIKEKYGAKKYKDYPIAKFECIYDEDKNNMEIYLCNFMDSSGNEYQHDSHSIAYMDISFNCKNNFIMEFGDALSVSIFIHNFYVDYDYNQGYGLGTLFWIMLMDDIVSWYCNKMNISSNVDVILCGKLAKADFESGNWYKSFPFYITISDKVVCKLSQYTSARTIFAYKIGEKDGKIDAKFCYDSDNAEDISCYNKMGMESYCQELIDCLGKTEHDGLVLFHFLH